MKIAFLTFLLISSKTLITFASESNFLELSVKSVKCSSGAAVNSAETVPVSPTTKFAFPPELGQLLQGDDTLTFTHNF